MSDIIDINIESPSLIEIILGSSPDIILETPDVIEILVGSGNTMDISMESPAHELEILGATRGEDGHTPYIEVGYWYVNGTNTGIKSTGDRGITGLTGPEGATGAQGANGIKGDVGPQGLSGSIGPQGAVGPQGVPGVNGNDNLYINSVQPTVTQPSIWVETNAITGDVETMWLVNVGDNV